MPSSPKSRDHGLLRALAITLLCTNVLFPAVSAELIPYAEQGFFFDWAGDQSPPVPTAAQCDTLHITWGRGSAPDSIRSPAAPYYLQIYTSTFIVPFVIPAGSATSYDWVVPFVPGTQFQICMFASNGVSGGCQNIYTVYQRPNTTLGDPPTCFNLTYPHAPLGVEASLGVGSWSQYGWIDQCSEISLKPTNGTPPFTYTIAPALHPPFNFTSNNTDPFNWTVSLMYGMPFWVSVTDAKGVGWTNGPLHAGGGGTTSCLDLNAALDPRRSTKSGSLSTGGAVGVALGSLILGALIGVVGFFAFARRQQRRRHSSARSFDYTRKLLEPAGHTPTLSMHLPSTAASTTFGQRAGSSGTSPHSPPADEHGFVGTGTDAGPGASPYPSAFSRTTSGSDRADGSSPTQGQGQGQQQLRHQHSTSASSSLSPASPTARSPLPSLGQGGGSHVYVVHHDGGRPPPVTVFTSDGTEVVELPPQYETAAGQGPGPAQHGQSQGPRALPLSPGGQQRRVARALPPKPAVSTMVAANADPPRSPSPS